MRNTGADVRAIEGIEALRRSGDLLEARRVAHDALTRFPYSADLHDAYARVLVDGNELELAGDAWETARTLTPGHVGALKGLGFLAFRRGDLLAAERLLADAHERSPSDSGVRGALERVRATQGTATPAAATDVAVRAPSPRLSEAREDLPEPADESHVLVADRDGFVLTGGLGGPGAADLRASTACEMGALARALEQAGAHLELGPWSSCLIETEAQAIAVAVPLPQVLLLTAAEGEGAAGRALARALAEVSHVQRRFGGAL